MKSHLKINLFIAAGSLLIFWNSGCSTNRSIFGGADKPALLKTKSLAAYNYTDPAKTNIYYLAVYNSATNKAQARNAILNDLMAMIDVNYYDYEKNLHKDNAVKNTVADIVTLGLTAAATAVGGEETKTILSAIATGVVGSNTAIDKNVLQNNTVQVLELEMRALRAEREQSLIAGMGASDEKYPLQSGIRDVIAYYYAGSLTDALMGLVQKTGSNAETNRASANNAMKTFLNSTNRQDSK